MELTRDITGALVTVDNGCRFTTPSGIATFVNGFEPVGPGLRRPSRPLNTLKVVMEPLIGILEDGLPYFAPGVTIDAQWEPKGVSVWDPKVGALVRLSKEAVIVTNSARTPADLGKNYGAVKILLNDSYTGEMYAFRYVVTGFTVITAGGDAVADEPGTTSTVPTTLNPSFISLEDQYEYDKTGSKYRCGDAMLSLNRDEITQQDLELFTYIEIEPKGESARQYTLWGGKKFSHEQTYDYNVYLKLLR